MLPNTYQQIEYIQSSGTQRIDTGYQFTQGYRLICNALFTSSVNDQYFSGTYNYATRCYAVLYGSRFNLGVVSDNISSFYPSANTKYALDISTISGDAYIKVDGTSVISVTTIYTAPSLNLWLFQVNGNGSPIMTSASMRMYGHIYLYDHNGTLIRDYVPVKRKSDSVIGLYDLINDVFYTNGGTGVFTGGSDVYSVTTSVTPPLTGSVTGDGEYLTGSSVTLTATPNPNYQFDKFVLNGYTKLDYIEASGTQFIDLDYVPNANTSVNLGIRLSRTSEQAVFGQKWALNGFFLMTYANKFRFHLQNAIDTAIVNTSTYYEVECDNTGIKVNNVSYTGTPITSFATNPLSIFTTNERYQYGTNGAFKLYSFKILENGSLVRDLIPVKRTSDDAIGLLDLVNLKFYGNDGTGTFSYGTEVGEVELPTYTELDYIESSGTQYIDTEETYNCDTDELEYEFEWVSVTGSTYDKVFGTLDSSGAILHQWDYQDGATNQSIAYGYNSANYKHSFGYALNTDYEVVVNKSGMTVNGVPTTFLTQATNSTLTSLYLFAIHYNGTYTQPSRIRLKKFIHRRNGTEIRSFIPVKRNDSTIGLLDLVNLKFYGNNGTGSFTYGSEVGALPITSFTITEDVDVTAYFLNFGHSVTLLVNPLGYGSVTGDGNYPEGASVTIEATPNTHKVFVNWTEGGVEISTNPSYTFTMGGADVTYTANFTDAQIFTIETSTSPSTMPSVYQSAYQVYEGESVTLRAREMSGYVFTGWSDGSTANPYLLIPTGNIVITANYIPVPTSTDTNQFRAYIKSQTDVNGLPIAFIDVRSFTIRRDLLTSATSDFLVLNVPTDVSNGDILVLYDSKGKVLYQGIIISIEDGNIQCSQIQSFYRGLWIYDTDPQSDLEGEIASLLGDFAQGKLKGSTYIDSLVATEKSGLTISTNSSTALSLPSGEGDMDMETFIYNLYKTYGMIFDINIAYESGGYTIISIPNYTPIKIGNNSEQVLNLSPVTEVAETNKLVVFASNGTYRSTFVYTSTNGIVEEPVTDVGRYGVINTKVVRTDDPITDVVASELPSVMYNHHLTFDLLMDGNLYNFDDLKLGQPIQVWNGTDYYSTIFTGYEMSCGENERPTSVHIVCGNVRLALTQKLLMGVIR